MCRFVIDLGLLLLVYADLIDLRSQVKSLAGTGNQPAVMHQLQGSYFSTLKHIRLDNQTRQSVNPRTVGHDHAYLCELVSSMAAKKVNYHVEHA